MMKISKKINIPKEKNIRKKPFLKHTYQKYNSPFCYLRVTDCLKIYTKTGGLEKKVPFSYSLVLWLNFIYLDRMHFSFFFFFIFLYVYLYTYFSLHHSIFKHVFLCCITQTFLYNFPFEWKERNPYMGFIIDIMNIKPHQKFEPKVIASILYHV